MRERSTVTMTPSAQLEQLARRLEQLRLAPEGACRFASEPPNAAAFHDSLVFLDLLPYPLTALPHISLAGDGEVNFAWGHDGLHIDLGFYGTGTYSYYARGANGREYYGDEVPAGSALPADLESLLRA